MRVVESNDAHQILMSYSVEDFQKLSKVEKSDSAVANASLELARQGEHLNKLEPSY